MERKNNEEYKNMRRKLNGKTKKNVGNMRRKWKIDEKYNNIMRKWKEKMSTDHFKEDWHIDMKLSWSDLGIEGYPG